MAELRFNPFTREWVMVASHRQTRPQMPKDWCPFCPGSGKVPDEGYTVLRYPNDFPALSVTPPAPDPVATGLFQTAPSYGRCEVILYAPEHNKTLPDLSDAHVTALACLWRDIFCEMKQDPQIKFVFIFENRGELVGVTMPHPHGQVYGYSYLPKKIELEWHAAQDYRADTCRCLFCDALQEEIRDGRRVVFSNKHFTVYAPFASAQVYGLHVTANRHVPDLSGLTDVEVAALGQTLRDVSGLYDALFNKPFPYMMCMHNAPVNMGDPSCYHFHVEFYPPLRTETVQQFAASSETGAGAWCNPQAPEDKALEMRAAYRRYCDSK